MDTQKIDAIAATDAAADKKGTTSKRLRASAFAEGGACLVLLSSQLGDRVVPLFGDRMTIGGRAECDVRIAHPDFDSTEIEVRRQDGGWRARNTHVGSHLLVNGEAVEDRLLRPNDAIDMAGRGTLFFSDRRLA